MEHMTTKAEASAYTDLKYLPVERSAFSRPGSSKTSENNTNTPSTNLNNKKKRPTVTDFKARESDARLIHVQYPGVVEDPSNALRTLGGIVKVSETFHHPQKKLELRFRPGDIFCNPIHGAGRTTVGLLVRVRRKKKKSEVAKEAPAEDEKQPSTLIDLNEEDRDVSHVLEEICRINSGQESVEEEQRRARENLAKSTTKGKKRASAKQVVEEEEEQIPPERQKLIEEEAEIAKEMKKIAGFGVESKLFTPQESNSELATIKTVVKLPEGKYVPAKSGLKLETVGVVARAYEFTGVSDLQYLPTMPDENGEQVSIAQNIFPGFGDPDNEFEFDYEDLEIPKPFFPFMLPHHLSHVDKPVQNIYKPFIINPEDPCGNVVSSQKSFESTRQRRSVYTYMMDFRTEQGDSVVPREPFVQALEDAAKKFYDPANLETIRRLFEERPVWTKLALQWETKLSSENLKFLLPCVAYFSLNGPWRSLWIRFGYDPRKEKTAFIYQLVDFRFPLEYRSYLDVDQNDRESYFKFKPDKIPPKSQMFYQLCDLKVPEIEELQGALTVRLNKQTGEVPVDPKYGYLDEDTMEFCRYCMSRCIEVRLFELGKISSVNLPPVHLEPGGSIPVNQLRVKYKKPKKRLRQMPTGRGRRKRHSVPEIAQVTYDFPVDATETTNVLADYFDDDEEMEEEDVEPYGREYEGVTGNLEDCFEDDEEDDEEQDKGQQE